MNSKIEQAIISSFKSVENLQVHVEGSDCGGLSIEILLISEDFDKVLLLKRHQRLQQLLSGIEGLSYHKIVLKTYTSSEYQKKLEAQKAN